MKKRTHAKRRCQKVKPTLPEFMERQIAKIRTAFRIPMRVTIIARDPENADAEVLFTDDGMDGLIEMMQRRRDAVVASQAARANETTSGLTRPQGE